MVLRGRVKSGRESSSSSFCISVTRTRDTSSGASGVSGVPLFRVSEASLSKPGGFSLLSSALDGVAAVSYTHLTNILHLMWKTLIVCIRKSAMKNTQLLQTESKNCHFGKMV